MLSVQNLSFMYRDKKIFQDLSFTLQHGEVLVIAGSNGSGKTTLLSVLSGALPGAKGTIHMDGERIGLVPQGNAIFEDLTVLENLTFFAGQAHVMLTRPLPMGLEPYASMPASHLSGGLKKRLAIACTQVANPDIWLFDEPCAGLDILWRDEMIQYIRTLKAEGHGILYVGHDPAEFAAFYDAILILGQNSHRLIRREEIPDARLYTVFHDLIRQMDASDLI